MCYMGQETDVRGLDGDDASWQSVDEVLGSDDDELDDC